MQIGAMILDEGTWNKLVPETATIEQEQTWLNRLWTLATAEEACPQKLPHYSLIGGAVRRTSFPGFHVTSERTKGDGMYWALGAALYQEAWYHRHRTITIATTDISLIPIDAMRALRNIMRNMQQPRIIVVEIMQTITRLPMATGGGADRSCCVTYDDILRGV